MLFTQVRSIDDGMLTEYKGVLYIGGQGYDLSSLRILPGKNLGCFYNRSKSINFNSQTVSVYDDNPMLLPRYMLEGRRNRVSLMSGDSANGYTLPFSLDNIFSGYGAAGSAAHMLDGTMTINADCTSYVPFLTYKGDDVANISPNVEDGGTVVAGALTANMATFSASLPGFGQPLQFKGNYTTVAGYYAIVGLLRADDGTRSLFSPAAELLINAPVLDVQNGNVLLASTTSSIANPLSFIRKNNFLVSTTIYQSPNRNIGATDNASARVVGVPAQTMPNGRRRAYAIQIKAPSSDNLLFSSMIEYDSIAAAKAGDAVTNQIDTTGFVIDKAMGQSTSFAYMVNSADGFNYIVAFSSNYQTNVGLGQVMVFKELSPGSLKMIYSAYEVVPESIRNVLASRSDNKEWLVMTGKGYDTWRWNDSSKKPERIASSPIILPAAVGKDSVGRIWVIERPSSNIVQDNYRIRVFPPEGNISYTETLFDIKQADYAGVNISANVNVAAYDRYRNFISANVTVTLTGPATFLDGSVVKVVATNSTGPTSVPVVFTGPGSVGVNGDI